MNQPRTTPVLPFALKPKRHRLPPYVPNGKNGEVFIVEQRDESRSHPRWVVMFRAPDGRVRSLSRFTPVPFASRQEAQVEAWKQARRRNAIVTLSDFVDSRERMGSPT